MSKHPQPASAGERAKFLRQQRVLYQPVQCGGRAFHEFTAESYTDGARTFLLQEPITPGSLSALYRLPAQASSVTFLICAIVSLGPPS
jgi:hypothetical protein